MGKFIDLRGRKYNRLTALKRLENDPSKNAVFLCRCDCGNEVAVVGSQLSGGHVKSCGCLVHESRSLIELKGKVFGRLIVIGRAAASNRKIPKWDCVCSCGTKTTVIGSLLRTGHTKSCGCIKRETLVERNKTHGLAKTKLYRIWQGMRNRCTNPNVPNYPFYGGRGIRILWSTFEEFYDDMHDAFERHVALHGEKDTTIERIENNGNYCKENCRFATWREQFNNTRKNRKITFDGKTLSVSEMARLHGLSPKVLSSRLNWCEWELNKAINTPKRSRV